MTEDVAAAKLEKKQQQEREGTVAPETAEGDIVESWYVVNQHLGLPGLLNENKMRAEKR